MTRLFEHTGAYTHNGDRALMQSLGLRVDDFGHGDFVDLGTVTVEEAETAEKAYGVPRPAATIKVEVGALPAQFWRFTIERPRDETEDLPDGSWRPVYEPVERFVITTGSGGFREYWAAAKMVAQNMLNVAPG